MIANAAVGRDGRGDPILVRPSVRRFVKPEDLCAREALLDRRRSHSELVDDLELTARAALARLRRVLAPCLLARRARWLSEAVHLPHMQAPRRAASVKGASSFGALDVAALVGDQRAAQPEGAAAAFHRRLEGLISTWVARAGRITASTATAATRAAAARTTAAQSRCDC